LHCHASRGSGSNLHIEEARLVVDQGSTDPRAKSLEVCVTEIMGARFYRTLALSGDAAQDVPKAEAFIMHNPVVFGW